MPATASIQEADSPFMACVTLTTADNAMLDTNITVELNTIDDTGKFDVVLFILLLDYKLGLLFLIFKLGL